MAVVVDEVFSGTAGANLTTSGVYAKNTEATLTGNITYRSGGGIEGTSNAAYYRSDVTLTNGENEWTFALNGPHTGTNAYLAVLNRMMTNDNRWVGAIAQGYFGVTVPYALFSAELLGADNGGYLFNDALNISHFAAGTYRFKLSSNGYLHRFFVNGTEYMRCRDNTTDGFLSGRAGVLLGGAWAGGYITRHRILTGFETNQLQQAGDSITEGQYYDDTNTLQKMPRGDVWGARLYALLTDAGFDGDFGNCAVSGRLLTTELSDYNTLKATNAIPNRVTQSGANYGWGIGQCRRANATHDVVTVMLGVNDLATGATTASVKTNLDSYVAALQGLGFKVAILTLPECDEASPYIPAGFNASVANVNAHIAAGNTGADLAISMDACEPYFSYDLEHRSIDGIHMRPASHVDVAQYVFDYPGLTALFGLSSGATGYGLGFGQFYGD